MLTKRTSERFAWGLFALMASALAAASDDDPRVWLQRMNQALTSTNYEGVFSHWQDGKVEMLRIIHRVKDGEVRERLVSLDGSGREFIRTGTELACYLPDKRTVLVEKRSDQSPLLGNFPSFDEASTEFYDVKLVKRTRFNRRPTRIIAVEPKDEFRYGYRLWIDEATAMPRRTQLCDAKGNIIEQVVFSDLTVNVRIPDSAFKPEVSTEGFRWLRNDAPSQPLLAAGAPALWNALKLPPGFRMMVRAAQVMPGSPDPVAHLVFSDGLASVSVFVEVQSNGRAAPLPGELALPPQGVARVGSSSAFSTVIEGHKVTAVGEVPPETVKFIANSVKSAPLSLQAPPSR
jgi:sigma-E factor negative regulatory protein RseB